ncbi:MAG TPA: tol-pal system-associated acyl-CoA thioesterase [Gammaproteobacteria bacterium]|nr:tol-pal system-associated acyl-CoA thioesterase [Gammaproteobacteria bacterium]
MGHPEVSHGRHATSDLLSYSFLQHGCGLPASPPGEGQGWPFYNPHHTFRDLRLAYGRETEYSFRVRACVERSHLRNIGEFIWPVRVYYEDTDSGGVVYYANYLRFMERARTEWLRAMGFGQHALARGEGVIFAVRRAELDYRAPARFDDLLQVSVRTLRCGGASIDLSQSVVRDGEEGVLCSGRIRIACLDVHSFRPRAIPERLAEDIRKQISITKEHR